MEKVTYAICSSELVWWRRNSTVVGSCPLLSPSGSWGSLHLQNIHTDVIFWNLLISVSLISHTAQGVGLMMQPATRGLQRCERTWKDKKWWEKESELFQLKARWRAPSVFITNHLPPKLCTTFQHIIMSWFLEHPSEINNDTSVWVRILSLFLKQDLFPLCFCCQVSSGMWGGDGRLLRTWSSFTTSQTLRQQGERRALKTQSENLHSVSAKEWEGGAEPVISYRSDR